MKKGPARLAPAHQPARVPQRERVPPRRLAGETTVPTYDDIFFFLAFFMGLLMPSLVLLVPLARQSFIAADCQA